MAAILIPLFILRTINTIYGNTYTFFILHDFNTAERPALHGNPRPAGGVSFVIHVDRRSAPEAVWQAPGHSAAGAGAL